MRGKDHTRDAGKLLQKPSDNLDAVHPGHLKIDDRHMRFERVDDVKRLHATVYVHDLESLGFKETFEDDSDWALVINNQHPARRW
jgi:hypothetical protein